MDAMVDEGQEVGGIADELAACAGDPERFVDTMFDWNAPELEGKAPEKWQREILRAIKDSLPLHRAVRIACASGHGVGKTCLTSWIILWAMATCGDCRGILTASNEAQLYTRNRAELRKWLRLFRGREFFELTATALISTDPARQQTWRCDLLPWNEHRSESFAGLHNQGARIIVVLDEASVIPQIIWTTIEPAMIDVSTEIIWCVFGNPLRSVGPFRECFGKFAHRWLRWHIDARDVGISDKRQIAEWAEDHAEDSHFFMTRVRGLFPTQGALEFIPTDLVEAAMQREVVNSPRDAMVLALSFSRPVWPRAFDDWAGTGGGVVSEYDPMSDQAMKGEPYPEARSRYYAPGWARLKKEYDPSQPGDWADPDAGPGEWQ
jgi:hypothetical protein